MMGGGPRCRCRNPGILFFKCVSVSSEVNRRLVPSSVLHTGEQCSVANDIDTEFERKRLGAHKAQEIAYRLSISNNADFRKVKAWLTSLDSLDQRLQWRSRIAVGILINIAASSVWFQDWSYLGRVPDWQNTFRDESKSASDFVNCFSMTDLALESSALARPTSCRKLPSRCY